jgi:predicted esterase
MSPLLPVLLLLAPGQSGSVRHELGVHLRAFESTLQEVKDPKSRDRAIPGLKDITFLYFSAQFGKAAKLLDEARQSLRSEKPMDEATAWAESLLIQVTPTLVEAGTGMLSVKVDPFYKAGTMPEGAILTLENLDPKRLPTPIKIESFPLDAKIPYALPKGKHFLLARISAKDKVLAERVINIVSVEKLKSRLEALAKAVEATKDKKDLPNFTLRHLHSILADQAKGEVLETDYPSDKLLAQAEAIVQDPTWPGKSLAPGEWWLALPEKPGFRVVRVFVPKTQEGQKVPLLLTLHGAGGSENMFFDGYGSGVTQRICEAKGWVMVAPRMGLGDTTLDQLTALLPIDDKKVFIMGHSMGASMASAQTSKSPERFRAGAYLGGGGRTGKNEAYTKLPAFVGVGNLDFALGSARKLHADIQKSGNTSATLKEYPKVEHLTIVQIAMDDLFAFFERQLKNP